MRPTHPLSASYDCEPETSTVPALTSPAYDTNTEPNKSSGPIEENTAISGEDLLDALIPQDVAVFATKFITNTDVVGQQDLDPQTDPVYGLMHAIDQINQRLPELKITGKDHFHQLMSDIYAECEEVRDSHTAASSASCEPDVTFNQDRHKSGDVVRLKRNMVKKIETGTLVKQHQVSKGVSAAHLPPVNHRLIVRDHEQSSQECLITANSSIDSGRSVSSFFATTPYPEDEDKFTRSALKCEHVSPAHEILADASLASECQAVEHQEEDAQLLYQTLLPFSTTAMPSQGFSVHSLSEEKQPGEVDWIDKAVHGSSPKLNTLDQVRLQMQHRNIHANDVGQYPTMVPTVSLIPDHDNDEAVGLGDDQACQFCSNWGCDYCKPDWFDSLLLEQGGPPDTRDGCGISDPGSERHQNVHARGALRVVHPAHRNSASTGAVTYQHKPSATLNPAATDNVTASRLNIGNAFSPALNGFKDFGSSKFEGSVPKYPPRFATPDILCDFDPNPRGDAVECWNNGTGLNSGSSSISGGGCCDTTSENVHWSSGDLSTKFSTMHEPPPSDTDFSDAGKFEKSNTIPTNNETLALEPYTVTYWATVECGDHITHIPLDSNNVTGSEKMILDGPAKKVWKWVQDKGLVNSISLQDAYDLAKDIQKSGIEHHAKDIEEGVGDIREGSRADSLVAVGGGWNTPSSLRS